MQNNKYSLRKWIEAKAYTGREVEMHRTRH